MPLPLPLEPAGLLLGAPGALLESAANSLASAVRPCRLPALAERPQRDMSLSAGLLLCH